MGLRAWFHIIPAWNLNISAWPIYRIRKIVWIFFSGCTYYNNNITQCVYLSHYVHNIYIWIDKRNNWTGKRNKGVEDLGLYESWKTRFWKRYWSAISTIYLGKYPSLYYINAYAQWRRISRRFLCVACWFRSVSFCCATGRYPMRGWPRPDQSDCPLYTRTYNTNTISSHI